METICILDTSICTDNLGDIIIMDAVNNVVGSLFPNAYVHRIPTHEALSDRTRKWIGESKCCFIGGTNLISSRISRHGLWRIDLDDAELFSTSELVALGVGWNDYGPGPIEQTTRILKTALSSRFNHSVRDGHTLTHLSSILPNVVNTSCPTTWGLTPSHCASIRYSRAKAVVLTLSAWRADPESDRALLSAMRDLYSEVMFFPQMQDDLKYMRQFGFDDIRIIPPNLDAYNTLLESEEVDFVGTRLHGGVRALQRRQRALILAIDNRATEIARDTGLPVVPRTDIEAIRNWVVVAPTAEISLPQKSIDGWKSQFSEQVLSDLAAPPGWHPPRGAKKVRKMVREAKRILT